MKKILKNSAKTLSSDLACEFIRAKKIKQDDILSLSEVYLNEENAKLIGKNKGKYVTLDTSAVIEGREEYYNRIASAIKNELKKLVVGNTILVVGLGNYKLEADSLGSKTCSMLNVTRKIVDSEFCVCSVTPGVIGATGIESFEVVKGVCKTVEPSTIIVVDSLCAGSVSRLLTSFQISNAGIVPGSGVENHRMELSSRTLGVNVISLGVPTVVYMSTIIKEYSGIPGERNIVVSPKDIDFMIKDCSIIIANAINSLFLTQ
ncbi:MAG: GPR endopeptidase [Clostridiales bacterium]|nr:GPR endopeptidase [Clostridiales bacterium]